MANESEKNIDEAVAAAEQEVKARKEKALSLGIIEKAREITEIMGERYHTLWCGGGGDLCGILTMSKTGKEYEDNCLRIRTYTNQDKRRDVVVELIERKRLKLLGVPIPFCNFKEYIEVFRIEEKAHPHHNAENPTYPESKVEVFKKEIMWIDYLTKLQEQAVEIREEGIRAEERQKRDDYLGKLDRNFGVEAE